MINRLHLMVLICLLAILGGPALIGAAIDDEAAQQAQSAGSDEEGSTTEPSDEELPSFFASTTVTATGKPTDAFSIATPVAVIPELEIERQLPDNAVDLFRNQPGVDVNGVGPNQARPIIRGQRGLRVLFMENGLRMNNARRQTDFGEISGLVDMDNVQAVEVVRGPASVLYGTDAIGGVLNLVTKTPAYRDGTWFGAELDLRYATAAEQSRGNVFVEGRRDGWSFNLGTTYRDSEDYEAASGRFGDIELSDETPVIDTGLQDNSVFGFLARDLTDTQELSLRFNRYRADQTGFGYVDPLLLGELDQIRILYPFQDFDRYTLGYRASALDQALADTVDVNVMYQQNERELANDIQAYTPFGGPGSFFHIGVETLNFTDLETWGLRGELTKVLGRNHLLTYGGEYYADDSFNTDFSRTTGALAVQFAPGTTPVDVTPPFFTIEDDVANTPNADNLNYGVFVQDQFLIGERLTATLGLRYSQNETEAKPTPGLDTAGLDFDDDAVVGAVNLVYRATAHLNLVGSVGTAFRAPNIVERLFNGPTPEGSGFQILNRDLVSEESENFDLGLKYRRRNAIFEVMYFRNEIDNGIIQNFLSPEEIAQLPPELRELIDQLGAQFVVQQQNIDKLRYEGVEVLIGYRAQNGISAGANYTYLDAERIDSDQPPTGDTFSDKVNFYLRYDQPAGRFWVEYRLRANGSADAVVDPDEPLPPVGAELPSFTIHTLAGGVTIFETPSQQHLLGIRIDNLTDELYSEFSNTSFFRPQSKRNFIVSYRVKV